MRTRTSREASAGDRTRPTTSAAPSRCEQARSHSSADRDHSPDARALRRSWAQLIKRVYEVDPLLCPKCGGEMRIIAFIIDHDVVDAILRHLAKAEAKSPRGPPGTASRSPPHPEPHAGSCRLCGVCSWRLLRGQGSGFEAAVPGQSPPATGSCRFERPIAACGLAPRLKNTPRHRVGLEWSERNFLSLN